MRSLYIIIMAITVLMACKNDQKSEAVSFIETGDEIIDAMSKEIEKNPSAGNYHQRGQAFYEREDYARAIKDLEIAVAKDSLNADYYHLLADGYLDYFRSRDALETMRKVLKIYPTRVPSLLKLAEMEYILKRNDVSIYNCNLILKDNPQNAEAYFMIGLNFRDLNDTEKAINSFQTAIELDPELLDAWVILGDLYSEKKDKRALQYYDSAIMLAPEKPEMKHSKAFHLQNNGDVKGALELYREIIVREPSYSMAYLNSGILYLQIDSLDKAFEQFDILAGREPTNPNAFFYRAQTQYLQGKYEQAKTDLQNTINLNSEDLDARKLLNEVEKMLREKDNG